MYSNKGLSYYSDHLDTFLLKMKESYNRLHLIELGS